MYKEVIFILFILYILYYFRYFEIMLMRNDIVIIHYKIKKMGAQRVIKVKI